MGDLLEEFMFGVGMEREVAITWRLYTTIMAAAVILYPLAMCRNMSGMSYFSLLSLFAVSYVTLLLIVQFWPYYQEYSVREDVQFDAFIFDANLLETASICFLVFTVHAGIFPIYSELENKTQPRIMKVVDRTVATSAFFYSTVCIFGYLSTMSKTSEVVVNRAPLGDSERDMFMMVARLFVYISLVVGFPVNYNPFRNNLFHIIFGNPNFTWKENFVMTTSTISLSCFLAIIFPEITAVFSIMGGMFATILGFFLPPFIHIKLGTKRWFHPVNILLIVGFGFMCLVGWTASIRTIIVSI